MWQLVPKEVGKHSRIFWRKLCGIMAELYLAPPTPADSNFNDVETNEPCVMVAMMT